ncbi:MAG: hypothetical protein TREMPRED_006024 [Tremellales sp. Tagirdzhanova-0007]|nr:MAG: hypothetical protein TREMPRED_006024 [Tremellales sp. Tagirdzhanova-0007]
MSVHGMRDCTYLSEHYLYEASFIGQLNDEPFDLSFPFLNPLPIDHLRMSPKVSQEMAAMSHSDQTKGPTDAINEQEARPVQIEVQQVEASPPQMYSMYHRPWIEQNDPSSAGHHQHTTQGSTEFHELNAIPYTPYEMSPLANDTVPRFHPYRYYGLHSPHFMRSTQHSISPSIFAPRPCSAGSQVSFYRSPPQNVSPAVVSPSSAFGSSFSDISPASMMYNSLPNTPLVYPRTVATPLLGAINFASLNSAGELSEVPGYPSLSAPVSPPPSMARQTRPKAGRRFSSIAKVKEVKAHDQDMESESGDGESDDIQSPGLGVDQKTFVSDESRMGMSKADRDRRSRIKSEQSRRDSLREGFTRLKDKLPKSTQRASKMSILDRSVAHIHQLETTNRYFTQQFDLAKAECATLRATNAELAHTIAQATRPGTRSSPGPARKV